MSPLENKLCWTIVFLFFFYTGITSCLLAQILLFFKSKKKKKRSFKPKDLFELRGGKEKVE